MENLNLVIENIMIKEGYIRAKDEWCAGRPVMITQNDYHSGLLTYISHQI